MDLRAFIKKVKDFIGFNIPSLDLAEEREHEIGEKLANFISKWQIETPAWIFTYGISPFRRVISTVVMFPMAPILEFLGIDIYDYIAFINKRENLEELLHRIEKSQRARRKR